MTGLFRKPHVPARVSGPMDDERPRPWVHLEGLPWDPAGPGARQKIVGVGDRQIRLLELTEAFEEAGWCQRSHWGILLEGRMELEFPDDRVSLQAGDALTLEAGQAHRHRAHVAPGDRALLFLIEPIEDR